MNDRVGLGQLGQSRRDDGRAQATKFSQLMQADGLVELCQDLTDAVGGRRFRSRLGQGGGIDHGQAEGLLGLDELQRDMILRRSGPVFSGKGQLGATPAQVKIGVAPAMQFAGAA